MAARSSSSSSGEARIQWVNYSYNKDDKELANEEFPDMAAIQDALVEMLKSEHRISLQWDATADAVAAFAFPYGQNRFNLGFALSSRASTVQGALRGLVYRHFVVFKERWANFVQSRALDE